MRIIIEDDYRFAGAVPGYLQATPVGFGAAGYPQAMPLSGGVAAPAIYPSIGPVQAQPTPMTSTGVELWDGGQAAVPQVLSNGLVPSAQPEAQAAGGGTAVDMGPPPQWLLEALAQRKASEE